MATRRTFLKQAGISTAGAALLSDPFIRSLAELQKTSPKSIADCIALTREINRVEDFLSIKFYFFNIEERGFICKHLAKIDPHAPAYVIVRLRQQHVAEELQNKQDCPIVFNGDLYSKTFLAGFSFLTFQLTGDLWHMELNAETMLDWSKFTLLTGSGKLPINLTDGKHYPLQLHNDNIDPGLASTTYKGCVIPFTLFEVPYKLWLSPFFNESYAQTSKSQRFVFTKNNRPRRYKTDKIDHRHITLAELWNNDLQYKAVANKVNNGKTDLAINASPDFRVAAYFEDQTDVKEQNLLPNPTVGDRSSLATQTNYSLRGNQVNSRYFNISSLGTSTYLHYLNPLGVNEVPTDVLEWKQDIKLGRDNYVEVVRMAVDLVTGLKLAVSVIAERRIEQGKSLLIRRFHFKYLESEIDFPIEVAGYNTCVYKKIVPKAVGSFYVDYARDSNPALGIHVAAGECTPGVLTMPYDTYDSNGNLFKQYWPVCIFESKFWAKGTEAALQAFNGFRLQPEYIHNLNGQKLAFAKTLPVKQLDSAGNNKRTELATSEVQLYTVHDPSTVNGNLKVFPKLKSAQVVIPQLEGIESTASTRVVAYATSYLDNALGGTNKAAVFLKIINDAARAYKVTATKIADDATIFGDIYNKYATNIQGIFSQNYKNVGGLVNPDVVIDNLSALPASLTYTDEMNDNISADISGLDVSKFVHPEQILRGLNVQLFGGIDLRSILQSVIPATDSPIFSIIEEGQDAAALINQYASEYQGFKNDISNYTNLMNQEKAKLQAMVNQDIETYLTSYLAKANNLVRLTQRVAPLVAGGQTICDFLYSNQQLIFGTLLPFIQANADAQPVKVAIDNFFNSAANQNGIKYLLALKQIPQTIHNKVTELQQQVVTDQAVGASLIAQYDALLVFIQNFFDAQATAINNAAGLVANFPVLTLDADNRMAAQVVFSEALMTLVTGSFPIDPAQLATPLIQGAQLTVGQLLTTLNLLTGNNLVLNNDLGGWSDWLTQNRDRLSGDLYQSALTAYQSISADANMYLQDQLSKVNSDIIVLQSQVSAAIAGAMSPGGTLQNLVTQAIASGAIQTFFASIQEAYHDYSDIITNAQNLYVALMGNQISPAHDPFAAFKAMQKDFGDQLKAQLKTQIVAQVGKLNADVKKLFDGIDTKIDQIDMTLAGSVLNVYNTYAAAVNSQLSAVTSFVNSKKQQINDNIKTYQAKLQTAINSLANFPDTIANELQQKLAGLQQQYLDGINAGEALQDLATIQNSIDEVNGALAQLKAMNSRTIKYTWNTQAFSDVDLGLLKFSTGKNSPTELDVNVKTTINFDITHLPPSVKSIDTLVDTVLNNFSIGFLSILTIDFDKVSFTTGSGVSQSCDFKVRAVHFDGPLNFVQMFQEYLSTLDKGLRFDIDTSGITLGYGIAIPDIAGGAFNFVDLKLNMDIRIPFTAADPMQITFGFSSPQELFMLTIYVFGGRGCLLLTLEPHRGITGIILIIEFGAVLFIDLGVAQGEVYLFAGIYINKQYDKVLIKGYLTCGGSLSILDIVDVSVTFYLGLEGNGKYLEGYCSLDIEIDIGPFISISVSVAMYKRIYGCPDNSQTSDQGGGGSHLSGAVPEVRTLRANQMQEMSLDQTTSLETLASKPASSGDIKQNTVDPDDPYWESYFRSYYHPVKP